jgi:molybdopterin molybdotransferase
MPGGILSFEDARHSVEEYCATVSPRKIELVELTEAVGRVLAEQLKADRDFPPFPRATRDGYALRSEDVDSDTSKLHLLGEIRAGSAESNFKVSSGEAVRIMTGAPVPAGADAVVMVEYTEESENSVVVRRRVAAGENVVPTGSEAKRGDVLIEPGDRLDEAGIAIAASIGATRLKVYSRPTIAVLATGDEIVDVAATPAENQIRNSNTYSLAAQIKMAGADPVLLPIAPDEPRRLRELIEEGLRADLLLLAGGVSMGKYDLVEQVLNDLGAEFIFTGAQIQPGKPIVFGKVRDKYFFGLPGNPVSTMVTFELFARPMIEALRGKKLCKLIFSQARLRSDIRVKTGLKRFLPGVLSGEFEQVEVELAAWQGSGDIAATARANCFVVIPPDRERLGAGEWVAVLRKSGF